MVYKRTDAFSFSLEHVLELNPQLLQGPTRVALYLSKRTGLEPTPPLPPDHAALRLLHSRSRRTP